MVRARNLDEEVGPAQRHRKGDRCGVYFSDLHLVDTLFLTRRAVGASSPSTVMTLWPTIVPLTVRLALAKVSP